MQCRNAAPCSTGRHLGLALGLDLLHNTKPLDPGSAHAFSAPLACARAPLQNVRPDIVVLTRLIPDAQGTSCNERVEPISGCRHARILRVPFRDQEG